MPELISASKGDAGRVIDVIDEAFAHDPTWAWAFPDRMARRQWWQFCVANALRYPLVLCTAGVEAVSVWIPPGGSEFSPEDEPMLPELIARLCGGRAREVNELLRLFDVSHPRHEPHHYLSLLGTSAACRGRGVGMDLLREGLARVDREGGPAYLESSNPDNDRRYRSLGFEPGVSFQAPGGGPVVTGMWREARRLQGALTDVR